MQELRITTPTAQYPIFIGPGAWELLVKHLAPGGALGRAAGSPVALVTDAHVWALHAARLARALAAAGVGPLLVRVLPPGEATKTRASKEALEDWLLSRRVGRDATVLAVGGGVVGDLAGFVAATYMRGVRVVHAPTSLLAMVDSALGGKTGVDTPAGKNLVGALHHPAGVYADVAALPTLPARELANGLAEVLKVALVADAALFRALELAGDALLGADAPDSWALPLPPATAEEDETGGGEAAAGGRGDGRSGGRGGGGGDERAAAFEAEDAGPPGGLGAVTLGPPARPPAPPAPPAGGGGGEPAAAPPALPAGAIRVAARHLNVPALTAIIAAAARVKARIVSGDEREGGERAVLNAGHTVGHALEALLSPGLLHGEAVAVGLVAELRAARALGVPGADTALVARVARAARALRLPTVVPPDAARGRGLRAVLAFMSVDKKNAPGGGARCVLPTGVGSVLAPPHAHAVPAATLARVLAAAVRVTPAERAPPGGFAPAPPPISVSVPGSKSISNRALLISALAVGATTLRGLLASDDTDAMVTALGACGVSVAPEAAAPASAASAASAAAAPAGVVVKGAAGALRLPPRAHVSLFAGGAGTVARFLTAALAAADFSGGGRVTLAGSQRMSERPIAPLVAALRAQGAEIAHDGAAGCLPLTITRGVHAGADSVTAGAAPPRADAAAPGAAFRRRTVALEARLSSQFVSAILMAAPFFPPVRVTAGRGEGEGGGAGEGEGEGAAAAAAAPPGPAAPGAFDGRDPSAWVEVVLAEEAPTSAPFIALTCAVMAAFGVRVRAAAPNVFFVPRVAYSAPAAPGGVFDVEPDAASASYPAAWAALTGRAVLLRGVAPAGMIQADAGFLRHLAAMGARVEAAPGGTLVRGPPAGARLVGLGDVNLADETDTFMTIAVVAAGAVGRTTITGVANQRVKECDRLAAMARELCKCGIAAWETPDGLTIEGAGIGAGDAEDAGAGAGAAAGERAPAAAAPHPATPRSPATPGAGAAVAPGSPRPAAPPSPASSPPGAAARARAPAPREPRAPPAGATIHCYLDHRIAMSFSVLGAVLPGVVLDDAAAVEKTFPGWWDVLDTTLGCPVVGVVDDAAGAPDPPPPPPSPAATPHTLVLVGMRGAGKSTLAAAAARELGWEVVDLDREVEAAATAEAVASAGASASEGAGAGAGAPSPAIAPLTCADVIAARGWAGFRALEARVLLDALASPPPARGRGRVIATGGGVVESPDARAALAAPRAGVLVVHIDRPVEDAEAGVAAADAAARGADAAARGADARRVAPRPAYPDGETFASVAARRAPLYAAVAGATFPLAPGEGLGLGGGPASSWAAACERFVAFARRAASPAPRAPRPAPHDAAAAGSGGPLPGAVPPSGVFTCLALPDVRLLAAPAPAPGGQGEGEGEGGARASAAGGAAWDALADAAHAAGAGADAVELRVDALTPPPVVLAALAARARADNAVSQLAILRAALAAGAARALRRGAAPGAPPRSPPAAAPKPIIWTVRSAAEGGRFAGGAAEYAALVRAGIRARCEWVDIEAGRAGAAAGEAGGGPRLSLSAALALARDARAGGARVIGSAHWPAAPPPPFDALLAAAALAWRGGAGADVVKLVAAARSPAEALAFSAAADRVRAALKATAAAKGVAPPPVVAFAMGAAGAVSRALDAGGWAPVAPPAGACAGAAPAAPGQLTAAALRALRASLGAAPARAFFLVGAPVRQSLSPALHNAGFAAAGLPHRYGLVECADAAAAAAILRGERPPACVPPQEGAGAPGEWAADAFPALVGGASITMPLKESILPFLDELSPAARALGAVNVVTVVPRGGGEGGHGHGEGEGDGAGGGEGVWLRGDNTDWIGVYEPLRAALLSTGAVGAPAPAPALPGAAPPPPASRPAMLVVGAGGTARAAAFAARRLGLRVVVANRSLDRAAALAAALGGDALALPLPTAAQAAAGGGALAPAALAAAGVGRVAALVCTLPPGAAWTAPAGLLRAHAPVAVLDAAYRPRATPLLAQAAREGGVPVEGASMLIAQGLAAWAIWTGATEAGGAPWPGAGGAGGAGAGAGSGGDAAPGALPWGPGVPVADMAAAVYTQLEAEPGIVA